MLDLIIQFISNIFLAWDIFWQMGTVEQIYEQFVVWSKAYHSSGVLPTSIVIEEFSKRVQDLAVVKEYCGMVDVVEMIKAQVPYDNLQNYCSFPEKLNEEMLNKFI